MSSPALQQSRTGESRRRMQHSSSSDEQTIASDNGQDENKDKDPEDTGNESAENRGDLEKQKSEGEPEAEGQPEFPYPVHIYHRDVRKVHKHLLFRWARTVVILMTFIMAVLSLYWGAFMGFEENMSALTVAVVSFDGAVAPYQGVQPLVGPVAQEEARRLGQIPRGVLGWHVYDPSVYNNDPIAVRQAVYDQHFWAAVIIMPNATALLEAAVYNGNSSYDPNGAMQVIYVEARQEETTANYVIPQLVDYVRGVQATVGEQWIQRVLANTTLSASALSVAPQALNPAVGASIFNLRPFGPPQVSPAVSIGLIYLIILSFFSFAFFVPLYFELTKAENHPPIKFWQLVIYRWILTTLAYFFMSLAYSLVPLAYQIPFANTKPKPETEVIMNPDAYGHATFFVYWMLNWVGMYVLGFASENVTMIVGAPWTGMWLVFWVISNVCTSFYSVEIEAGFYSWGYAWPLHNVVEGSRTLLFDIHSRIGLNFGVLFVWAAVNTVLFPCCCMFFRYTKLKQQNKHPKKKTAFKKLLDWE